MPDPLYHFPRSLRATDALRSELETFTALLASDDFKHVHGQLIADIDATEAELAHRERNKGSAVLTREAAEAITEYRTRAGGFQGHVDNHGAIYWGAHFIAATPTQSGTTWRSRRDRFGNHVMTVDDLHATFDRYVQEVLIPYSERLAEGNSK